MVVLLKFLKPKSRFWGWVPVGKRRPKGEGEGGEYCEVLYTHVKIEL
jgi:hypothetical protein